MFVFVCFVFFCFLTGRCSDVRAVCPAGRAGPTQQVRPPEVHLHADPVRGGRGASGAGERGADSASLAHLALLAGGRGEGAAPEGAGRQGHRDQDLEGGAEKKHVGTKAGQSHQLGS